MRVARWLSALCLLSGVAAAEVQLIAGGGPSNGQREGAIILSTDNGVNWREVWYSDAPNARVHQVRYFAEPQRFVAAGNFGVLYSTDGENWVMANADNGGGRPMVDVAYGGGTFMAVGPRGGAMYSHDGKTWKHLFYHNNGRLDLPAMKGWEEKINARVSDSDFRGVAYAGGAFIATGTYERALAFSVDKEGKVSVLRDKRNALSSLTKSTGIISDGGDNVLVFGPRRHWMSNDGGKNFRRVRQLKKEVVLHAVRIENRFYLAADRSVLVNGDLQGKEWTRAKQKGSGFFDQALGQVNGNLIAVPLRPGVIRLSVDLGGTWVETRGKLSTPENYQMHIDSITGRILP